MKVNTKLYCSMFNNYATGIRYTSKKKLPRWLIPNESG